MLGTRGTHSARDAQRANVQHIGKNMCSSAGTTAAHRVVMHGAQSQANPFVHLPAIEQRSALYQAVPSAGSRINLLL